MLLYFQKYNPKKSECFRRLLMMEGQERDTEDNQHVHDDLQANHLGENF